MIISGNNSQIIKTKNISNIYFFKNININEANLNIDTPRPQPGDLVTCPDGFRVPVDEYGNYYCNIDPNGNGLYPFTDIRCTNDTDSIINVNGNISNGCQPANGSIVTCISGITSVVENGTYDCAQGEKYQIEVQSNGIVTIPCVIYTLPYEIPRLILGYDASIITIPGRPYDSIDTTNRPDIESLAITVPADGNFIDGSCTINRPDTTISGGTLSVSIYRSVYTPPVNNPIYKRFADGFIFLPSAHNLSISISQSLDNPSSFLNANDKLLLTFSYNKNSIPSIDIEGSITLNINIE